MIDTNNNNNLITGKHCKISTGPQPLTYKHTKLQPPKATQQLINHPPLQTHLKSSNSEAGRVHYESLVVNEVKTLPKEVDIDRYCLTDRFRGAFIFAIFMLP